MSSFQHISVKGLKELMRNHPNMHILDVRDHNSFYHGHIDNAFNLSNDTLEDFVNRAEFEDPVVVVCYHGIMSQKVAQYLLELGFDDTYSLDGGYQAWVQSEQPSSL
tara:strand:+ start:1507 stop:1827 length:321 start_codon:yes stop_codon:yes gene_type:complete